MSTSFRLLATAIGTVGLAGCGQALPSPPATASGQAVPLSWVTAASPNPHQSRNNQLYGVSCVGADDC